MHVSASTAPCTCLWPVHDVLLLSLLPSLLLSPLLSQLPQCLCRVSCRAIRARDELVSYFQAGITEARQQQARGQELKGVLGRMVSAQDKQGNRCGFGTILFLWPRGAVGCVPLMTL